MECSQQVPVSDICPLLFAQTGDPLHPAFEEVFGVGDPWLRVAPREKNPATVAAGPPCVGADTSLDRPVGGIDHADDAVLDAPPEALLGEGAVELTPQRLNHGPGLDRVVPLPPCDEGVDLPPADSRSAR